MEKHRVTEPDLPAEDNSIDFSNELNSLSSEVLGAAMMRMPFGRFEGRRLIDLPEPYVVWFKNQGFPPGKLGHQLALIYELKLNGLEKLIKPLIKDE